MAFSAAASSAAPVVAAQLDLQGAAAVLRSPAARDAGDVCLGLGDAHVGRLDGGGEFAHVIGDLPDGAAALAPIDELDLDAALVGRTAARLRHVVLDLGQLGELALDALGDAVRLLRRGADGRLDVDGEARLVGLRHVLHADKAERHERDDRDKYR